MNKDRAFEVALELTKLAVANTKSDDSLDEMCAKDLAKYISTLTDELVQMDVHG